VAFVHLGDSECSGALEEIDLERLDSVCGTVSRPRLIKIDVEGGELDVLESGARTIERWRPFLIVELSATQQARFGCHPLDVVAWIRARGYRVSWIGDLGRSFCEADLRRGAFIDVVALPGE
jgi:hypothetical protein